MADKLSVKPKSRIQLNKDRVKAIRPALTMMGYRNVLLLIADKFPAYNTIEGGLLIKNVWEYRSTDTKVIEILEKIAKGKIK